MERIPTPQQQGICIARARVIVNMHYYEEAGLETHRVDAAHAKGKCVVSERSTDPALDVIYEKQAGMPFVEKNDIAALIATVRKYSQDKTLRTACAEAGYQHVLKARVEYPQALHDAVERLNC